MIIPPSPPGSPPSGSRPLTSADASTLRDRLDMLEREIFRLRLICHSLGELLVENTSITREQLGEKLREVDLRDGKPDGMLRDVPRKCGGCGRLSASHHAYCMYCGEEFVSEF